MIPMSHGGDGLGPVYNETSCVACHGLAAPRRRRAGEQECRPPHCDLRRPRPRGQGLNQIHPGFHGTAQCGSPSLRDRSRIMAHGEKDSTIPIAEDQPNRRRQPDDDSIEGRIRAAQTADDAESPAQPAIPRPEPSQGFNSDARRAKYSGPVRRGPNRRDPAPTCWSPWPSPQPDRRPGPGQPHRGGPDRSVRLEGTDRQPA